MNESVGIALLSMMVTVITFVTGFMLVFAGRLLGEVSGMLGYLKGFADRLERIGSESDKELFGEKLRKKIEAGVRDRWRVEVSLGGVFLWSMLGVVYLLMILRGVGDSGWEDSMFVGWVVFVIHIVSVCGLLLVTMYVSARFVELSRQREVSLG
jgi:hypothetical protein